MLPADRQAALDVIAHELGPMTGRPFGVDEHGERIEHGTGRLVVGALDWLREFVERDALRSAAHLSEAERAERREAASQDAISALVTAINASIPDRRYHVTASYLLNEGHNYSYEFRLYVSEFARAISGDPRFFFHHGPYVIPSALGLLSRPLGTRGTYAVLPRLVAKVIKTDLRAVEVTDRSATFRWYGQSQLALVPEHLRERYIRHACETYRGTFADVPVYGGNLAGTVEDISCQADGAPYCEWIFSWDEISETAGRRWFITGAVASLGLLAVSTAHRPRALLARVGALLPVVAGYLVTRLTTARDRGHRLTTRLDEQRALAEEEYDANTRTNSELQSANVVLQVKLSELTALHELSVATQATLQLDVVLDQSLATLVEHLSFERALVMLVDVDRGLLTSGRSLGGTPEQDQLVRGMEIETTNETALFAHLLGSTEALLFEDLDQAADEPTRMLAQALGATSVLGTPLITKGKRVGILAVDNGRSGRPLADADRQLLFAAGSQIAGAIGSARLYEAVERQNESLQREVRELRIEVDDHRQSEQVAAITGSEYFQDLRRQAIELRGTLGVDRTTD